MFSAMIGREGSFAEPVEVEKTNCGWEGAQRGTGTGARSLKRRSAVDGEKVQGEKKAGIAGP